jgi:hypothetical protein
MVGERCNKGKIPHGFPLAMMHGGSISGMSRSLNEGSSFSAIQTTGRFVDFHGPANVVLEGRVHHQLRDVINHQGRPSHWFIYDAAARAPGRAARDCPQQMCSENTWNA